MNGRVKLSVSVWSIWKAPWVVGRGKVDFRSDWVDEKEVAEHTTQTQGGV